MNQYYISQLSLSSLDRAWLSIRDFYGFHRIVCSLYGMHGIEKEESSPSGVLWRLIQGASEGVRILMLSNREPKTSDFGKLDIRPLPERLLQANVYRYSICVNPTRYVGEKRIPITTEEGIRSWFERKAFSSGFEVSPNHIAINGRRVIRFKKGVGYVTLFQADLSGTLKVTDRAAFTNSFLFGIGRGKAFGCGLLQIIPIN